MIMCLDVGNSQIYGGIFKDNQLLLQFRRHSRGGSSSDEYGIFLRSVLRKMTSILNPLKESLSVRWFLRSFIP